MRRRKVLVGIGALTAGGTAVFGTEAFSSAQAERNVDVTIAGDQNAFVAIQPMSGDNAGTYVATESDSTVELNFDGDNSGPGQGVNQDGITQFEDLFRVVNQGSQTTSVYFEDSSDAVTFRVTRSTDTETTGTTGQSLEGAANSVELDVGEQVVVGLTVDTLNNDVSGDLLDSVTLLADSSPSAPQQSIPEPQFVVTSSPSGDNEFEKLSSALGSSDVSSGSVIGIEATSAITESSQISVDNSVTIVGVGGPSKIDATGFSAGEGAIEIKADSVTLRNFTLDYSGQTQDSINGIQAVDQSDLTIDGLTVNNTGGGANPAINAEGSNGLTITNNTVTDGNIGISHNDSSSETITVSGNYVNANSGGTGPVTEGIFLGYETGGDISNKQFEIKNNLIKNSGSDSADIKVGPGSNLPGSLNGQTGKQAQLESVLTENDISRARADDGTQSDGTLITESLSAFSSLQDAVDIAATTDGVTLVQSGSYAGSVTVDNSGFTLKGFNDPTIDASGNKTGLRIEKDGVTVRGLTVDSAGDGKSGSDIQGIFIGIPGTGTSDSGTVTVEDVNITNVKGNTQTTEAIHIKSYDDGWSPITDIDIKNVTINSVTTQSGGGADGIKIQAGVTDVDIIDTTIKNLTGQWGIGITATASADSNATGNPTDVEIKNTSISAVSGRKYSGVGVQAGSASGSGASSNVADPNEFSFTNTFITDLDIGLENKNTTESFPSNPSGVTFQSVDDNVVNYPL